MIRKLLDRILGFAINLFWTLTSKGSFDCKGEDEEE
jgi:hypothetical protein